MDFVGFELSIAEIEQEQTRKDQELTEKNSNSHNLNYQDSPASQMPPVNGFINQNLGTDLCVNTDRNFEHWEDPNFINERSAFENYSYRPNANEEVVRAALELQQKQQDMIMSQRMEEKRRQLEQEIQDLILNPSKPKTPISGHGQKTYDLSMHSQSAQFAGLTYAQQRQMTPRPYYGKKPDRIMANRAATQMNFQAGFQQPVQPLMYPNLRYSQSSLLHPQFNNAPRTPGGTQFQQFQPQQNFDQRPAFLPHKSRSDSYIELFNSQSAPRPHAMQHSYSAGSSSPMAGQYYEAPVEAPYGGPFYTVQFKMGARECIPAPACSTPSLEVGSFVITETDNGEDLGVVTGIVTMNDLIQRRLTSRTIGDDEDGDMGRILRVAVDYETQQLPQKFHDEALVRKTVIQIAEQTLFLPLQVLEVEYQFDRQKITIFYTSAVRVEFRELIKSLFSIYKTRIWFKRVNMSKPFIPVEYAAMSLSTGQKFYNPNVSCGMHSGMHSASHSGQSTPRVGAPSLAPIGSGKRSPPGASPVVSQGHSGQASPYAPAAGSYQQPYQNGQQRYSPSGGQQYAPQVQQQHQQQLTPQIQGGAGQPYYISYQAAPHHPDQTYGPNSQQRQQYYPVEQRGVDVGTLDAYHPDAYHQDSHMYQGPPQQQQQPQKAQQQQPQQQQQQQNAPRMSPPQQRISPLQQQYGGEDFDAETKQWL